MVGCRASPYTTLSNACKTCLPLAEGCTGIETLFTLWNLLVVNPDNVFVARGNHEDEVRYTHCSLCARQQQQKHVREEAHLVMEESSTALELAQLGRNL